MSNTRKTVTRHKAATITMAAVLVLSLIVYFASESILRRGMVKPIKREKVDFAKALDWLPPKAKQELEYRARYLDLKQKYEMAEANDDKLQAAYKFAIHTRDMNEHNEVLLPFVRNREKYAETKDLYLAFVQMLYNPKNPKAISIQQYYDFINTLKDPLDIFTAWNEGRNRLNRVAGRDTVTVVIDYLKPLLDKPLDFFAIREYTWCLDNLRNNARRLSMDASKRIAANRERENDRKIAGPMMKLALKADELRGKIANSKTNYSRGDYLRKNKLENAYKNAKNSEARLKNGFEYAKVLRDPVKRKALILSLLNNPEYAKNPLLLKIYALQVDSFGAPDGISEKDFLTFLSRYPDPGDQFLLWHEALNRLNGQRATAEQKLRFLHPLMAKNPQELPFTDYAAFYDQISRCAVYLNDQDLFEKSTRLRDAVKKTARQSFRTYQEARNQKK